MALTGLEKPLEEYNRDDIRKIAGLYGIKLSTIITQKLNKSQVIELIKSTKKYRDQQKRPTDDNSNRIRPVLDRLIGIENPDDLMMEILSVLTYTELIPSIGRVYVFVYSPKTPNIEYDEHPFVAVTDIFRWGFRGLNFHWGEVRQYTWEEVVGSLHLVYKNEIKDLQELPFGKIRLNS